MRFFGIFLISLMIISLVLAGDPCSRRCSREFDHVCGKYPDGHSETFSNPCVMEMMACEEKTTITELHKGFCEREALE
ncbi:vasotab-TY2-like [Haematobia irritans]|uniref:vasotab-TY2-like n=1 Tax=Haematobia irritans TaxID=7368 RepID=UPI003F50188C